jgi:hypothetical protein
MEEWMDLSEGLWHRVIDCTSIMLDIVGAKLVYTVSVWRCVDWLYSRFEATGFRYWHDSVTIVLLWALWRPLEWVFRPLACTTC